METNLIKQTFVSLHQAVEHGNVERVEEILKDGGDINGVDQHGKSPLHIAVNKKTEDEELVTFLLKRGADAKLQDRLGNTPLMSAILSNPGRVSLIMMSTSGKDTVNIPNDFGDYPLHYAAVIDDTDVAKILLDYGAFIECKDSGGRTPLIYAVFHGTTNVIDQLLVNGADVNCKDDFGCTPLHWAKSDVCITKLLKSGAQINVKDYRGWTPLHYNVTVRGNNEVILLLQMGAEVNSQDNDGKTPLHLFESRSIIPDSILQIGNTLLDWGASITIEDAEGRIPSDICPAVVYCAKQYDVRRACVKLSDHTNDNLKLNSYKLSGLEEAERLKLVRFGRNSLYDVFRQYSDPVFLFNEPLKEALSINDYRTRFPIYSSLLKSTFKRANKRAYVLETAAETLKTHSGMVFKTLPREVIWNILTFVDDDNLLNVIKIII